MKQISKVILQDKIEDLTTWIINNPKEYKHSFSEHSKELKDTINSDEFHIKLCNLIQEMPEIVSKNIRKAEKSNIEFEVKEGLNQILLTIETILNKVFIDDYLETKRQTIIEPLNGYKKYIENKLIKEQKNKKLTKVEFKTFEDLFYDKKIILDCIDILKNVNPPLIDADNNYIGKSKGAICVWYDELKKQGLVKKCDDRKVIAKLIPLRIKNFSIDESMFGKIQIRAERKYLSALKKLITKIKLSQDSQK